MLRCVVLSAYRAAVLFAAKHDEYGVKQGYIIPYIDNRLISQCASLRDARLFFS